MLSNVGKTFCGIPPLHKHTVLTVGIFDKSMVSTLSILGGGGKTLFFTFVEYGWELEKCLGVCLTGSIWGSGLELKKLN